MKKYITVGLAFLFFISGLFLFSTDAKNYVHYSFRNAECLVNSNCNHTQLKTYTNRRGSFADRQPTRHRLKFHDVYYTHPSMRANTHLHPEYRKGIVSYRDQKLLRRLNSPELYPRYMNEYGSGVNIVRNGDYKDVQGLEFVAQDNVYVYNKNTTDDRIEVGANTLLEATTARFARQFQKRQEYSIQKPYGFTKINGVYRSSQTSLAIRITESPEDFSCHQQSFELCAIDYRKQFIDDQDLLVTSSIKRVLVPRTILKSSFAKFPGVSEAFYANGYGQRNVYFLFSVYNPKDGSVVHIESVANVKDAYSSAQIMEKVYQSFRFHF